MARRKTKTADAIGDVVGSVLLLGAAGVVAYFVYELIQAAPTNPYINAGLGPTGPINALNQSLIPITFPGGGETPGTSETYTGATTQTVLDPAGTVVALVGGNPVFTPTLSDIWSNVAHPFDTLWTLFGGKPTPAQIAQSMQGLGLRRTRRADGWR